MLYGGSVTAKLACQADNIPNMLYWGYVTAKLA